jgi:hypothetical protein
MHPGRRQGKVSLSAFFAATSGMLQGNDSETARRQAFFY